MLDSLVSAVSRTYLKLNRMGDTPVPTSSGTSYLRIVHMWMQVPVHEAERNMYRHNDTTILG